MLDTPRFLNRPAMTMTEVRVHKILYEVVSFVTERVEDGDRRLTLWAWRGIEWRRLPISARFVPVPSE